MMPALDSIFGVELGERVSTLQALLLRMERGADLGALGDLGRELHSLKGAARAVGAGGVERLAHAAEGAVLARQQRGGQSREVAWCDALYAAVDAFAPAYDDPTAEVIGTLVLALDRLAAADRAPEPQPAPEPQAAPQPQPATAPQPAPQPRPAPAVVVEAPAPAVSPSPSSAASQGSVRVAITKLDALLTESGELSVTHLRLSQRLNELRQLQRELERWQRAWAKSRPLRARIRRANHHGHTPGGARDVDLLLGMADQADQTLQSIVARTSDLIGTFSQNTGQLGAVAGAIGQEVMAVRLQPAGTIFTPLERLVRDLARQTGKEARLVLGGIDTEIDRRILDELRDPLMHMVRNSLDHGIEPADERLAAGKPACGTLRLEAEQRGDRVHICVEDDGRGLETEAIRATAVRRGLLSAERAAALDPAAVIDLIFQPGFSTRTTVSELSGRGVGMDVVREHVTRLGGDIGVRTTPGAGTCFTVTVPLTLATTRVLLVEEGGQTFAVPSSLVERTGRIRVTELQRLEGRRALHLDGRAVPVVELADVLRQPADAERPTDEWRPFFVLAQGERSVALLCDRLVDEQELVVKGLGAPLVRVRHVGGAAVLGTGAVVVILNPADLVKSALGSLDAAPAHSGGPRPLKAASAEAPRRRVLVADDSVMTRTLERSILESAGYEVIVATDGQHALELLGTTAVDAVVSDVEMPRLTGIQLTGAIRQDERLRHLPVVLVTSLDAPEHVERGAAAGADAYIVKGRFDQNELLQTLGRLL